MADGRYVRQRPLKLVKNSPSEESRNKVIPLEVIEEKAEVNEKNVVWSNANPAYIGSNPEYPGYTGSSFIIIIVIVALLLLIFGVF